MALIDTLTQDNVYHLLLAMLSLPDEDGVKQKELRAFALLLSVADETVWRAFKQAFPDMADETLDDWEQELSLPNDRSRTPDQRRDRIVSTLRAHRGSALANAEETMRILVSSAIASATTPGEVISSGAENETVYAARFAISPNDWATPAVREIASFLARRILPARSIGDHWTPSEGRSVHVHRGARWGSAAYFFDRDALGGDEYGFVRASRRVPIAREVPMEREPSGASHIVTFGPGSLLQARDLNTIQRSLMPSMCVGPDSSQYPFAVGDGIQAMFFSVQVGELELVDITPHPANSKGVPDWRDRMLYVVGYRSAQDIRPGGTHGLSWGTGAGEPFMGVGYSNRKIRAFGLDGAAATPFVISFGVNDAAPNPVQIEGDLGGGTTYACGVLIAGPVLGKKNPLQKPGYHAQQELVKFAKYGSMARMDSEFFRTITINGSPSYAHKNGQAGLDLMSGYGLAASRVFVLNSTFPQSLVEETKVIDSSVDWRDRFLFISVTAYGGSTTGNCVFPGASYGNGGDDPETPMDVSFAQGRVGFHYTGQGGDTVGGIYNLATSFVGLPGVKLMADTLGRLVAYRDSTDVNEGDASFIVTVLASPQLGTYSDTTSKIPGLLDAGAADGSEISPRALNVLQESGIMSQARGDYRRGYGSEEATIVEAVDTFPLGSICSGFERRPMVLRKHDEQGNEIGCEYQPLNGQLVRFFDTALTGLAGAPGSKMFLVLDDANDWRDRFISFSLRADDSDVRPEGAFEHIVGSDLDMFAGVGGFYSGPGIDVLHDQWLTWYAGSYSRATGTVTFPGKLFVDTQGRLCMGAISDGVTTDRYAVGIITASPQLGPRSPAVRADLHAPPIARSPAAPWDDTPLALTGHELRFWLDAGAGVVTLADKVVAVADQSATALDIGGNLPASQAPFFIDRADEATQGPDGSASIAKIRADVDCQAIALGQDKIFTSSDLGLQSPITACLSGVYEVAVVLNVVLRELPSADGYVFGYGLAKANANDGWPDAPGEGAIDVLVTSTGAIKARTLSADGAELVSVTSSATLSVGRHACVIVQFDRAAGGVTRIYIDNVLRGTSAALANGSPLGSSYVCLGRYSGGYVAQDITVYSPPINVLDAMLLTGTLGSDDRVKLTSMAVFKTNSQPLGLHHDWFTPLSTNERRYFLDASVIGLPFYDDRMEVVAFPERSLTAAYALNIQAAGANGHAAWIPVKNRGDYAMARFFGGAGYAPVYTNAEPTDIIDIRGSLTAILAIRAYSGDAVDAGVEVTIADTTVANEIAIGLVNESGGNMVTPWVSYAGTKIYCSNRRQSLVRANGMPVLIELHHESSTGLTTLVVDGVTQGTATITTIAANSSSRFRLQGSANARFDLCEFAVKKVNLLAANDGKLDVAREHFKRYFVDEVR